MEPAVLPQAGAEAVACAALARGVTWLRAAFLGAAVEASAPPKVRETSDLHTPPTPAAVGAHGLTDLATELAQLSKAQRWEEMPPRISDDVLRIQRSDGGPR